MHTFKSGTFSSKVTKLKKRLKRQEGINKIIRTVISRGTLSVRHNNEQYKLITLYLLYIHFASLKPYKVSLNG